MIRAGVGFSDKFSPLAAASEAVAEARQSLPAGTSETAALVFATAAWGPGIEGLVEAVADDLDGCPMLGASAAGLFAAGRGTAENPGLAVALIGGLEIEAVTFDDWSPTDPELGREIVDHLNVSPDERSPLLILAELGHQNADPLLDGLAAACPDASMFGLAASPLPRGRSVVWRDGEVLEGGIVAAVLAGAVHARSGVARGCRQASPIHRVTRARDRWISTLAGQPALPLLEDVARQSHLPPGTESLRQLLVEVTRPGVNGQTIATHDSVDRRFVNIAGIDPRRNAILLPEHIEVGAEVCFAVRDAVAARENLEALVEEGVDSSSAFGLFLSGNSLDGAGENGASRDARCFRDRAPTLPVLGVRGEQVIGPGSDSKRSCGVLTDTSVLTSFEN